MAGSMSLSAPGLRPLDLFNANAPAAGKLNAASKEKARASAQDFEAVFLNSMFQQMFTGLQGDGPFGGSGATTPSIGTTRSTAKLKRTPCSKRCGKLSIVPTTVTSRPSHSFGSSVAR